MLLGLDLRLSVSRQAGFSRNIGRRDSSSSCASGALARIVRARHMARASRSSVARGRPPRPSPAQRRDCAGSGAAHGGERGGRILARRRQAMVPLEGGQRLRGLRAERSVRRARVIAEIVQHALKFGDNPRAQTADGPAGCTE